MFKLKSLLHTGALSLLLASCSQQPPRALFKGKVYEEKLEMFRDKYPEVIVSSDVSFYWGRPVKKYSAPEDDVFLRHSSKFHNRELRAIIDATNQIEGGLDRVVNYGIIASHIDNLKGPEDWCKLAESKLVGRQFEAYAIPTNQNNVPHWHIVLICWYSVGFKLSSH